MSGFKPAHDAVEIGDRSGSISRGTPIDWAVEAHDYALDVAYAIPGDVHLGADYFAKKRACGRQAGCFGGHTPGRMPVKISAPHKATRPL